MADTRLDDKRIPWTKDLREAHPDWSDEKINFVVDQMIADSVASSQMGSPVWMNRPDGLTVEQYRIYADNLKVLYTPEQIAWFSTKEAADEYRKDPILFLVKYYRYV